MEQSPWEADSSSASQEVLYILCNPKSHYPFQHPITSSNYGAGWIHATP